MHRSPSDSMPPEVAYTTTLSGEQVVPGPGQDDYATAVCIYDRYASVSATSLSWTDQSPAGVDLVGSLSPWIARCSTTSPTSSASASTTAPLETLVPSSFLSLICTVYPRLAGSLLPLANHTFRKVFAANTAWDTHSSSCLACMAEPRVLDSTASDLVAAPRAATSGRRSRSPPRTCRTTSSSAACSSRSTATSSPAEVCADSCCRT